MADLFDLADLPSVLQIPQVDNATAINARRRASGWLRSATGLTDWPSPIPDELWGWALDLAVMAYENPGWAQAETIGGVSTQWGDLSARRAEILTAAAQRFGSGSRPLYNFPDAVTWPQPVEPVFVDPLTV